MTLIKSITFVTYNTIKILNNKFKMRFNLKQKLLCAASTKIEDVDVKSGR